MKEFDKIYVAKYYEAIPKWQLSRDLGIKVDKLESIVDELKQKGLYDTYKRLSDDEWEKLEKKTDSYILNTYLPKKQVDYIKIFNEFITELKLQIAEDAKETHRYKFEIYKPEDYKFEFNYFQEEDFEGEEWKQIGKLNYEVSNYGRIKNTQTKKLKALKHNKYGMQVLLWQNSKSYTITISRLVATMFIRKVEADERVSHINGNIRDNYYKNLRIVKK